MDMESIMLREIFQGEKDKHRTISLIGEIIYSTMKKNEISSFVSKWMELKNIILLKLARFRRPKIVCSPSYADFDLKQMQ
jgi:hypothetical protein